MKITIVLERLIEAVTCAAPGSSAAPAGRAGCRPSRLRARRAAPARRPNRSPARRRRPNAPGCRRFPAPAPGIGLRDQEIVHADAELAGIDRIERVLGVDEGAGAALLLRLGHAMQRQRGLARGFRAIDLDHPPRGSPPMPSAISRPSEPVETTSTSRFLSLLPSRMIEPCRNCARSGRARHQGLRLVHDEPSTRRSARQLCRLASRPPYDQDSPDRQCKWRPSARKSTVHLLFPVRNMFFLEFRCRRLVLEQAVAGFEYFH